MGKIDSYITVLVSPNICYAQTRCKKIQIDVFAEGKGKFLRQKILDTSYNEVICH